MGYGFHAQSTLINFTFQLNLIQMNDWCQLKEAMKTKRVVWLVDKEKRKLLKKLKIIEGNQIKEELAGSQ